MYKNESVGGVEFKDVNSFQTQIMTEAQFGTGGHKIDEYEKV